MNDPLHTLNQAELAVMFWQAVVDSGLFPEEESVMLENPSTRAVFPCCTLSVPLARPLYMGCLLYTSIFETARMLFPDAQEKAAGWELDNLHRNGH